MLQKALCTSKCFMKALARKRRFPLSRKCLPESAASRFPESAWPESAAFRFPESNYAFAFRFPESNYAFQKAIRKALSAFPAREVLYLSLIHI